MKTIYGVLHGEIKKVTFKEFLGAVKRKAFPNDLDECTFCVICHAASYGIGSLFMGSEEDPSHKLMVTRLQSGSSEKDVALTQLFFQSNPNSVYKKGLDYLLEDAIMTHMEQFGSPTHLVNIGPRLWMVCDIEDFAIVENNLGIALISYCYNKTVITKVDKSSTYV